MASPQPPPTTLRFDGEVYDIVKLGTAYFSRAITRKFVEDSKVVWSDLTIACKGLASGSPTFLHVCYSVLLTEQLPLSDSMLQQIESNTQVDAKDIVSAPEHNKTTVLFRGASIQVPWKPEAFKPASKMSKRKSPTPKTAAPLAAVAEAAPAAKKAKRTKGAKAAAEDAPAADDVERPLFLKTDVLKQMLAQAPEKVLLTGDSSNTPYLVFPQRRNTKFWRTPGGPAPASGPVAAPAPPAEPPLQPPALLVSAPPSMHVPASSPVSRAAAADAPPRALPAAAPASVSFAEAAAGVVTAGQAREAAPKGGAGVNAAGAADSMSVDSDGGASDPRGVGAGDATPTPVAAAACDAVTTSKPPAAKQPAGKPPGAKKAARKPKAPAAPPPPVAVLVAPPTAVVSPAAPPPAAPPLTVALTAAAPTADAAALAVATQPPGRLAAAPSLALGIGKAAPSSSTGMSPERALLMLLLDLPGLPEHVRVLASTVLR